MIRPTYHLDVALDQGYFIFNGRSGYATGQLFREFTRLQESEKRPIISIYTKSKFASISIDPIDPMTKDQAERICSLLQSKDKRKFHPYLSPGNTSYMVATRIPLAEAEETAKKVVSILREG